MVYMSATEYVAVREDVLLALVAREARRENTSIGSFAKNQLGISRSYLYLLASGERKCSRRLARRFADALDVPLATIADDMVLENAA